MFKLRVALIGTILLATSLSGLAQRPDTVLSFQKAKDRLFTKNLGLLAAYYEIGIAKAKVIQAKVWNNPNFIINGDLYNQETNEYFHLRNQSLWQLEQTISIAGKHTNSVKLARIGVEMAEKQMEDVLRSLLFEMGNTYCDLAAVQQKEVLYRQVLQNYDRLIEATRKQLEVGAISTTEAVRLEAEYLDVKADALTNHNEKERLLGDLRTLLYFSQDTTFLVEQRIPAIAEEFDPNQLADQAASSRPDVAAARINIRYQEKNLQLQQSSGVPDIKLGYQPYDRGSNYIRPYHGFTTEIFLPLYDRNQGRIKQAKLSVSQSNLQYQQMENGARNEVIAAYNRYRSSNTGLANYTANFLERLSNLNISTNQNFQKRNISLLQFIDQQRIYILTNIQLIELKQLFLNNVNELNFAVGQTLIDY
ncbi:MAG: TolC family protein [Cyclobacteriaceae bacterium]|nr:TolC family protein [Cyclobacteriaceae bacterium]